MLNNTTAVVIGGQGPSKNLRKDSLWLLDMGKMDCMKHRLCISIIERMVIHLFWAEVGYIQYWALVSDTSDVLIEGGVTCTCLPGAQVCSDCSNVYAFNVLFDVCRCDICVCFDACGVFVVV